MARQMVKVMTPHSNQRTGNRGDTDYLPLGDEGAPYDVTEDNNRGPMVLALALGVIAIFGVVVWNAYKQGVRAADSSALPYIASEGAFKKTPNDGASSYANRNVDLHVLDQVSGEVRGEGDIQAAVVREEPLPVATEVSAQQNNSDNAVASKQYETNRTTSNAQTKVIGSEGAPVRLGSPNTVTSTEVQPTPTPERTPKAIETVPAKPIQKPTALAKVEKPIFTPQTAPNGKFLVQIAAVQNRTDVANVWQRSEKRSPTLFRKVLLDVQTVDLGAKGVWHRIRAGSFDSRTDASAFCKALKNDGGDCIVVEK